MRVYWPFFLSTVGSFTYRLDKGISLFEHKVGVVDHRLIQPLYCSKYMRRRIRATRRFVVFVDKFGQTVLYLVVMQRRLFGPIFAGFWQAHSTRYWTYIGTDTQAELILRKTTLKEDGQKGYEVSSLFCFTNNLNPRVNVSNFHKNAKAGCHLALCSHCFLAT